MNSSCTASKVHVFYEDRNKLNSGSISVIFIKILADIFLNYFLVIIKAARNVVIGTAKTNPILPTSVLTISSAIIS